MLGETVELILSGLVIGLVLVGIIWGGISILYNILQVASLNDKSLQNFDELTTNIKELKQDEKLENQIIYLAKNHELVSFDKEDSEVKPEKCYMDSCLCLCLGDELKDCEKENAKCIIGFEVNKFEGDKERVKFEGDKIFYLKVLKEKDIIKISETEIKSKNKIDELNIDDNKVSTYNFEVNPKPNDKILLENLEKLKVPIYQASEKFGVSPNLIKAVIAQESDASISFLEKEGKIGINCNSYCGLMQVGETAFNDVKKTYSDLLPYTFEDVKNRDNIEAQIFVGTAYLKLKLQEFGNNEELALAAYNAGSGRIKNSCENSILIENCKNIPIETKNYVPSVLTYKNAFGLIS